MLATYRRIKQQRAAGDNDGGFTLIELLIVIVVLGILAAVVVFSLGTITQKGAIAACESDAQTLNTGISAYFAGTGVYPTTAQTLSILAPTYLQTVPTSTHYSFTYVGTTTSFTLSVNGTGGVAQVVSADTGAQLGASGACSATAAKVS
jgi:prepilin-type N-terminal cleavage/methylation domain-containing protein